MSFFKNPGYGKTIYSAHFVLLERNKAQDKLLAATFFIKSHVQKHPLKRTTKIESNLNIEFGRVVSPTGFTN